MQSFWKTLTSDAARAVALAGPILIVTVGCGGADPEPKDAGHVTNEASVAAIYANFEPTIARIVEAGLKAKGTATQGAPIPEISFEGKVSGKLVLGGSVAQSVGLNERLTLWVQLDEYSDTGAVTYSTSGEYLDFSLTISNTPPDNQALGNLDGDLAVSGDVTGVGTFKLSIVTDLQDDDAKADPICTHITGTVSDDTRDEAIDVVVAAEGVELSVEQSEKCSTLQ